MLEIAKIYNPKEVEDKIYRKWEKSGYFNPDNLPRQGDNFSIPMPPPNVTGTLHLGHAVMLAIEDILIRYHRMRGNRVLWLPGTDHAAIATQTKVEKILAKKTGKTRHALGRERFLGEVEKFINQTKNTIKNQIRKMGSSCDWSREAYTMDEPRSRAVRIVFKMMYDNGLIYRGERIVNWCPSCGSTLADDEVEYKESIGKLYYIKYPLKNPKSKIQNQKFLIVATTRPETKLGDTALAVHPDDVRYKKYIGKEFDVNLVGQKIHVKVFADKVIDPKFGTGVLGVTPAHSQIDFELAGRHKLPFRKVIGQDGKMTDEAGKYKGLLTLECRKKFVEDLKADGLLEKVEDYKHNIGVCYRCGTIIEPLTSLQWFVDVDKRLKIKGNKYFENGASLKEVALKVVRDGEIKIIPDHFKKTYFHWIENLRDWCISRQIWFGHRVPVWYKKTEEPKKERTEKLYVGVDAPAGKNWAQDQDTLDTWFSSSLWTFSTLLDKNFEKYKTWEEWVKNSKDLQLYHPTSVLETGYDILFFWIARMILMTTYVLGDIPFKNVYLHGIVRDEKGRKMSKSLGNIIDPLDMIEKYGTDAVRLSLVLGTSPGNDFRLYEEKIAGFRNFTNKLWNVGRYVLGSSPKKVSSFKFQVSSLTLAEKWILSRLDTLISEVTEDLENFRFSQAGERLRAFTWDEFADWYLEINKLQPNSWLLATGYLLLLKLWHPFMPYVTEEMWLHFSNELLMVADWPKPNKKLINKKAEEDFESIKNIIIAIRNIRADYKIEPVKLVPVIIYGGAKTTLLREQGYIIKKLARAEKIEISRSGKKPAQSAGAVIAGVEIYMPLAGLIDIKREWDRLQKELIETERYLFSLRKKLMNKEFQKKAPREVIGSEEEKFRSQQIKIRKIKDQLKSLSK